MISILLYVAAFLALPTLQTAEAKPQQAKVVYEQHFVETPESQNQNLHPQSRQIPLEYLNPYPNSPEYVPEQSHNAIHQQQQQSNDGSHDNYNQNHNQAQFHPQKSNQFHHQNHHKQQHFYQQQQSQRPPEELALFAPIQSINNNQIQHQPHNNNNNNHPQQQQQQQQQPLLPQGLNTNMHHSQPHTIPINRNGFPFGPPKNLPPGAIPVPIPASQFHARRGGPINSMMKGVQRFAPRQGNTRRRNGGTPIRMSEMHRLPKPPKYPLYDMPEVGMATPPPPPLMHPMSLTAMATSMYPSFALPGKRGRKNRRRPKHPPLTHNQRKPPRPGKKRGHHHHGPPHGGHGGQSSHGKNGHHHTTNYEHTMASSMDPQVSSPPLGRPLTYDEYMQRPSHSFTDDPWNFDPQAVNYNSGMNTFAMKYNYDPLGMNSLDKEQSHLDPDSLSYPGDTHVMQDSSGSASTSQIGGWDMKPETYRNQHSQSDSTDGGQIALASDPMTTSLKPPPIKSSSSSWNNHSPIHNQYDLTYNNNGGGGGGTGSGNGRNEPLNSFNIYDQSPEPSSRSNSLLKSDTLNLDPLKILSDANPGIEFTVESSSNGAGIGTSYSSNGINRNENYNNQNQFNQENENTWNQYPQKSHLVYNYDPENLPSAADNDPALSVPQTKEYLQQLRQASKFENGIYDTKAKLHTMALAQDYVAHNKPVSDLSDNYNPYGGGGLNTGLMPPTETAAMFKRQGAPASAPVTSRTTRGDKIPMVELEGLSLLNEILKSHQTAGTRKQLYRVLTM